MGIAVSCLSVILCDGASQTRQTMLYVIFLFLSGSQCTVLVVSSSFSLSKLCWQSVVHLNFMFMAVSLLSM